VQVLAASGERLTEAKREVEVMSRLRHPHCLNLLDSDIVPSKGNAGFGYIAYLLFPAYTVRRPAGLAARSSSRISSSRTSSSSLEA
jgi:hypothetical protein